MTKNDIISMAREAGLRRFGPLNIDPEIELFANLVEAAQRDKQKQHSLAPGELRKAAERLVAAVENDDNIMMAMDGLRQALAQPEQEPSKQFHEWACAEHQKIVAESANSTTSVVESKALAQLEQDCYSYAVNLATNIWEKRYKDSAPQWEPFDNLAGVLTQIANMTYGLLLKTEQEPVAHLWECIGRWTAMIAHDGENANLSTPDWLIDAVKAATAPPKREWVDLDEEEQKECWDEGGSQWAIYQNIASKLKEKNT